MNIVNSGCILSHLFFQCSTNVKWYMYDKPGVLLPGPAVGQGELEGEAGGPAVRVEQPGGQLQPVLLQQRVQRHTGLAHQPVVQKPETRPGLK